MPQEDNAKRIAYFDHLRIFAIFLIIILHVSSYCWYDTAIHSSSWLILNAYKTLTDHAVLLFVMISGSLFLGRDVPMRKLYLKYVLRMLCAFIVWSFIYALVSNYMWGIKTVLIITFTSHYHLWFIPMIAGLYICLPILRQFVKTDKMILYFLIISFVFSFFIPTVLNLLSDFGTVQISAYMGGQTLGDYASYINDRLEEAKVYMIVGYSFYFVAGYYINKTVLSGKLRYILYFLGIISFIITFFTTMADTFHEGSPSDAYHNNFNIAVMFSALATFVLFKQIINNGKNRRFHNLIARLSKYSFGAYLIHALVIEQIALRLGINALSIYPVLAVPLISIVTFVAAFALSALLNKIPFINKYIV